MLETLASPVRLDRIKSKSGFIAIESVESDGREEKVLSEWIGVGNVNLNC